MFYSDFSDMSHDSKLSSLRCYKYNLKNNSPFRVKLKIKLHIHDRERMSTGKIYENTEIKPLDATFLE